MEKSTSLSKKMEAKCQKAKVNLLIVHTNKIFGGGSGIKEN
jgi:ribosomal protein L7Ae-like RNA K-turn-binding protein